VGVSDLRAKTGCVFAIDETAGHDGPGLRMTVYLKGCPLSCIWCHSPESISPEPQVVWYGNRCAGCGRCIEACPENLRTFEPVDGADRSGCRLCGACIGACPNSALEVKGYDVTAGDIIQHALQLVPFFRRSGGGVTLTGGEPTYQVEFSSAVLQLCREEEIHTAVETCGYAGWERLERLVPVTDLFLYDLKHIDEDKHLSYTGGSNVVILDNLRRLVRGGSEVILRLPLIPGHNDSPGYITRVARTASEMGIRRVSLLPFNPASAGKYSWIHRAYPLGDVKVQGAERLGELRRILEDGGLEVVTS